MNTYVIGGLEIGSVPRVVGSVTQGDTLNAVAGGKSATCDIVELRLDLIGVAHADWLARARAIEASGRPVLLTVRMQAEGGGWDAPEAERLPLLEAGLHHLAAIDIEAKSTLCAPLCALAESLGKPVVVSSHDFERTPPIEVMHDRIAAISQHASAIPKVATAVNGDEDQVVLRHLLVERGPRPLCVIGMGERAKDTRITFATMGSCLTYGFLDSAAAPGQWPAPELVARLTAMLPEYAASRRVPA